MTHRKSYIRNGLKTSVNIPRDIANIIIGYDECEWCEQAAAKMNQLISSSYDGVFIDKDNDPIILGWFQKTIFSENKRLGFYTVNMYLIDHRQAERIPTSQQIMYNTPMEIGDCISLFAHPFNRRCHVSGFNGGQLHMMFSDISDRHRIRKRLKLPLAVECNICQSRNVTRYNKEDPGFNEHFTNCPTCERTYCQTKCGTPSLLYYQGIICADCDFDNEKDMRRKK